MSDIADKDRRKYILNMRQAKPQILGFIVNAKGITWNLRLQLRY